MYINDYSIAVILQMLTSKDDYKDWITVRSSNEFVSFLENKIAPRRMGLQNTSINGMIDEALNVFVTDHTKVTRHNFLLRVVLSDTFFIKDPSLEDLVKIKVLNNKLFCNHHKFIHTECQHTIWASQNPVIRKKINKINPPYYKAEHKTTWIRVRRKLFEEIKKKTQNQRRILRCSENDILMNIVLNYYS